MALAPTDIVRRRTGLAQRLFEGELLVISAKESMLHRLNETGTCIWDAIEEPRSVQSICTIVSSAFPHVDRESINHDIMIYLKELSARSLVTIEKG